jgi:hypothetical protein
MIVLGSIVTLAIFLLVGWAVSTEMFQQRAWRQRVAEGDVAVIAALLEEAVAGWRRERQPREIGAAVWAGVNEAQIVAVSADGVTVSSSAEAEFRTEGSARVQVASALDSAITIAAKLADRLLYDVPNLRLGTVRVDIYSTFMESDGQPVQKPILSTTAERGIADDLAWDALMPTEVLGRFQTNYDRGPTGLAQPIRLPPIEGTLSGDISRPGAAGEAG